MRGVGLILTLVLALAAGYFIYQNSVAGNPTQVPAVQEADIVSIRGELLTIGAAERQYFATHAQYGSLDDLQAEKLLPGPLDQQRYVYSAVVDGDKGFTVTAGPRDTGNTSWPTLTIDQSMQIGQR